MSEWEISKRKLLCLQERKLEYQWATKKVNTHKKTQRLYRNKLLFISKATHWCGHSGISIWNTVFEWRTRWSESKSDKSRKKQRQTYEIRETELGGLHLLDCGFGNNFSFWQQKHTSLSHTRAHTHTQRSFTVIAQQNHSIEKLEWERDFLKLSEMGTQRFLSDQV